MQYADRKKIDRCLCFVFIFVEIFCIVGSVLILYDVSIFMGTIMYFVTTLFACAKELRNLSRGLYREVAFVKISYDNKLIYYNGEGGFGEINLNKAVDYGYFSKILKKHKFTANESERVNGFKMEDGEFICFTNSFGKKFKKRVLKIIATNTGKDIKKLGDGKIHKEDIERRIVIGLLAFLMIGTYVILIGSTLYDFFIGY